jgi:holo-[acyl-carrier protein] synthase
MSRGQPHFEVRGTVDARVQALGITSVHVSLSHDAGIASAVVVAEGPGASLESSA